MNNQNRIKEYLQQYSIFKTQKIQSLTLLQEQGFSNTNYMLITNVSKYIVRYFKQDDIDRDFEFRVQLLGYECGVAAKPLWIDINNNIMVSEYIEGYHKARLNTADTKAIAILLRKLHSIAIDKKPHKLKEILASSIELDDAFDMIGEHKPELVLCHHDLNPQNIIFGNTIKLIDWEYAGVNDRYFDLASICVEFNLNSLEEDILLVAYFDYAKTINHEKLSAFKIIYKALCSQWWKER